MKNLLDYINQECKTNIKTPEEFADKVKELDKTNLGKAIYKYIYYQSFCETFDIENYLRLEK